MKLYHGTKCRNITKFDFEHSRKEVDLGKGIYFTSDFEQAEFWSCHYGDIGAVYECDIDLSKFKILSYNPIDEDLIYILYLCRIGLEEIVPDSVSEFENADIISCLMLKKIERFLADAESFNEGIDTQEEFSEKIRFFNKKPEQLCIKSDFALEEINNSIKKVYHTKKENGKIKIEKIDIIGKDDERSDKK